MKIKRFNLAVIDCISVDNDNKELIAELNVIRKKSAKLYAEVLKEYKYDIHEEKVFYTNPKTHETIMCNPTDDPKTNVLGDPNYLLLKHLDEGRCLYCDYVFNCTDKTIQELIEEENEKDNV